MKSLESLLSRHIGLFFSSYLTSERGVSPHTIRSYAMAISQYLDFLDKVKHVKDSQIKTNNLTKTNVLDFLSWLETIHNVTIQTRNQRLSAIHSFCRYLSHTDVIHIDRWQDILSIKTKKSVSQPMSYLSVDAIKFLLEQVELDTAYGRRNLAMLALLYDSGARVNELIQLRPCDLHLDNPAYIVLQGKGNKNRSVPLQEKQVKLLRRYINDYDLSLDENQTEPLFKNRVGGKLTSAGVTYLLQKYVTLANEKNPELVPKHISPHCLRHSKAMHLLQAGVNLIYIRDILGHASIMTTEIYARADSKQKRDALEAAYTDIIPQKKLTSKPSWESDKALKEWLKSLAKHN